MVFPEQATVSRKFGGPGVAATLQLVRRCLQGCRRYETHDNLLSLMGPDGDCAVAQLTEKDPSGIKRKLVRVNGDNRAKQKRFTVCL